MSTRLERLLCDQPRKIPIKRIGKALVIGCAKARRAASVNAAAAQRLLAAQSHHPPHQNRHPPEFD